MKESCSSTNMPLHEALHSDHLQLAIRTKTTLLRRNWLNKNQKLIRAFTLYCTLHSAQNPRLTSALMELLLLLLEIQQGFFNDFFSNFVVFLFTFERILRVTDCLKIS